MRPPPVARFMFVRTKATLNRTYKNNKSGERPPYYAPDPLLNNPRATYMPLNEGGLTLIHRPPPTAPTPFSLTTNPSSPLLRPPPPVETPPLPPLLRPSAEEKVPPTRVSDEALAEIRRLRLSNPKKYTRGVLAKMFGCTNNFVSYVAALKRSQRKPIVAAREEAHEKHRERWGKRKELAKAIEQKRREFW